MVMCLDQGAHLHMAQLIPLPLTVFWFFPSWWYLSGVGSPG